MIWWVIGSIILMGIIVFVLSILLVFRQSNRAIDEMLLAYNDYVELDEGQIRHVYAVMDLSAMKRKETLEPVYPVDLKIIAYHGYTEASDEIEHQCHDKDLSNGEIIRIIHTIKQTKKGVADDKHSKS